MKSNLVYALVALGLMGCSTAPPPQQIPPWIRQSQRTLTPRSIVFVESVDDFDFQKSKFRSESTALADVANECSLIPKGTRVDDHYSQNEARIHQTYAKVSVDLALCEQARRTTAPEAIKALADLGLTQQVQRLQQDLKEPDWNQIALSEHGPDVQVEASRTTVSNEFYFYILRQQIVAQKQAAVLSNVKATQRALASTNPQEMIRQIQKEMPELIQSTNSWSHYRDKIMRAQSLPQHQKESLP